MADWTEEHITTGLMAMIQAAGNATAASRYLKSEKDLSINAPTLNGWRTTHAIRYDDLRERYRTQMEENLSHEMRDVARLATEAQRLAIERTQARLIAGEEHDPSRAAANLGRVAQTATDKLLALTGRPTQITETRNLSEILRSLAAKGVIEIPAEAVSDAG